MSQREAILNELRTALRSLENARTLAVGDTPLHHNLIEVDKELYVIWRDVSKGGYDIPEAKHV